MGADPLRPVRIAIGPNRLTVRAEARDDVVVDGTATVTEDDHEIRIDGGGRLVVCVPEGTDVVIGASSGRVTTEGRLGAVRVVGETGRIVVDRAQLADVRTGSARVEIGTVDDHCSVRTTAGRIEVTSCGGATISTGSGRIDVHGSRGAVHAHCVSGRVSIDMDEAADVIADAVSGRVTVRYPSGVRVGQVEGSTANRDAVTEDVDCCVIARSVSGRVEVTER